MPGILWKRMDGEYSRSVLTNAQRVPGEPDEESHGEEEMVRVYIRLEQTASKEKVIARISDEVLPKTGLKVHNQALAEDLLSADIPYGKISEVRAVEGVKEVSLVKEYGTLEQQPGMAQEGQQKEEEGQQKEEEGQQKEERKQEKAETAEQEQPGRQEGQQAGTEDNSAQKEGNSQSVSQTACIAGIVILLILLGMAVKLLKRRRK